MGFSFRGICHTKIEAAETAFCQSLSLSSMNGLGQIQSSTCLGVVAPNVNIRVDHGGTKTDTLIAIPPFQACDHDGGVSYSLEYFVIALGFLALIAASKAILNIFRGRSDVA